MKKIHLSSLLIVAFGASFLQAQPSRLDSVIAKFQNDNRSFEEFVLLGKIGCYGNVAWASRENIDGKDDSYSALYGGGYYNWLSPFARLLKEQSITDNINEYYLLNKKKFEMFHSDVFYKEVQNNKGKSPHYLRANLCDSLFNKSNAYKKQYLKLVNDKNNYITKDDIYNGGSDIESYRKDYLEHYFIQIKMDVCPKRGAC